eukprot:5932334-Prymnesium_polylepis.1
MRFSERDQLSFAYVSFAMGLTPPSVADVGASLVDAKQPDANASALAPLVHLLPRRVHWSVNVRADTRVRYNSSNPFEIARRVGHARRAG